jgi:hypothetical protein
MSNQYYDEGPAATGKKVMLATPSYDSPAPTYVFAIARSREALTAAGIQSSYLLLHAFCHVDDGRNKIVREFLDSDCTDLVFLDADVDWEPEGLVKLCQYDLDIVGGVYPYRREYSEEMPVRLKQDARPESDLLEVEGLPTGFMKIRRSVLESMAAKAPVYFDKYIETALVFDRPTPGEDKTRWGGDVDFCNRWRAQGGKIYAALEIRLGHTGTVVVRDSLGSHLRRVTGRTLTHVIDRVREGTETLDDYGEAFKYVGNNFAADPLILKMVTEIARKCRGPIIETGSGLSSVFMGAASCDKVYSLEHEQHFAARTVALAEEASVGNVGVCYAPLKDFWYDVEAFDLPNKFAFGFCDGPPRMYGTRMLFFDVIASRCTVIVVDDVEQHAAEVHQWADSHGYEVTRLGRAALLKRKELNRLAA